jgi:hypothetical protein
MFGNKHVTFIFVSSLVITLVFSWSSESIVFARINKGPVRCAVNIYKPHTTTCCQTTSGNNILITYCTDCKDTEPPSDCGPRYESHEGGSVTPPVVSTEPPPVAPPKSCPDGSSPDANGVCPPVTQGSSSPPSSTTTTTPPKNTTGAIEQPPTNLASPPKTSQRAFSPTGGCVPGGTTCIPCDPGLATHGANCIPSGDWRPGSSGLGTELGAGGSSVPPTIKPPAQKGVTEQPPTNLASPPKSCPDGSSPDANSRCPTTTTENQNPQSSGHHKSKGSDLTGQQLPP